MPQDAAEEALFDASLIIRPRRSALAGRRNAALRHARLTGAYATNTNHGALRHFRCYVSYHAAFLPPYFIPLHITTSCSRRRHHRFSPLRYHFAHQPPLIRRRCVLIADVHFDDTHAGAPFARSQERFISCHAAPEYAFSMNSAHFNVSSTAVDLADFPARPRFEGSRNRAVSLSQFINARACSLASPFWRSLDAATYIAF